MSIGIFDSGIGGLTVFKAILKDFPNANIFYLGDTARVPYGNKSKDTIIRYSVECATFLKKNFDISLLIVACNTASSYAVDTLKNYLNIPVIDVINPGVEYALKISKTKRIGVIGTQATIRSGSYQKLLKENGAEVFSKPCPLFVPLVEEGRIKGEITRLIIKDYLQEIIDKDIDTLILGCTHYPLLKEEILTLYPYINIVDSTNTINSYVKKFLHNIQKNSHKKIFITDEAPSFYTLKNFLLPEIPLEKVELSKICSL
ncbi:MAG: glutamate racemase [Hydrogenothermus sp.]|nr:MAG: glutamate racemase [Hydrogenothermus sp.]